LGRFGLLHCRPDGTGVGRIGLVAQHKGAHALGVQQTHLMTLLNQFACPPVGTATSLDGDQRRLTPNEELQHLAAFELVPLDLASLWMDGVKLNDLFGNIHAEYAIFHVGSSCLVAIHRTTTLTPRCRDSEDPPPGFSSTSSCHPVAGGRRPYHLNKSIEPVRIMIIDISPIRNIPMSQLSFSEAEYAGKRKQTRREKFLAQMERAVPWKVFADLVEPHYPK